MVQWPRHYFFDDDVIGDLFNVNDLELAHFDLILIFISSKRYKWCNRLGNV